MHLAFFAVSPEPWRVRPSFRINFYKIFERLESELVRPEDFNIDWVWIDPDSNGTGFRVEYVGLPGCEFRATSGSDWYCEWWFGQGDDDSPETAHGEDPFEWLEMWMNGLVADLRATPTIRLYEDVQAAVDAVLNDLEDVKKQGYFTQSQIADLQARLAVFESRLEAGEKMTHVQAQRLRELEALLGSLTRERWLRLAARRLMRILQDPEIQTAIGNSAAVVKEIAEAAKG